MDALSSLAGCNHGLLPSPSRTPSFRKIAPVGRGSCVHRRPRRLIFQGTIEPALKTPGFSGPLFPGIRRPQQGHCSSDRPATGGPNARPVAARPAPLFIHDVTRQADRNKNHNPSRDTGIQAMCCARWYEGMILVKQRPAIRNRLTHASHGRVEREPSFAVELPMSSRPAPGLWGLFTLHLCTGRPIRRWLAPSGK